MKGLRMNRKNLLHQPIGNSLKNRRNCKKTNPKIRPKKGWSGFSRCFWRVDLEKPISRVKLKNILTKKSPAMLPKHLSKKNKKLGLHHLKKSKLRILGKVKIMLELMNPTISSPTLVMKATFHQKEADLALGKGHQWEKLNRYQRRRNYRHSKIGSEKGKQFKSEFMIHQRKN